MIISSYDSFSQGFRLITPCSEPGGFGFEVLETLAAPLRDADVLIYLLYDMVESHVGQDFTSSCGFESKYFKAPPTFSLP